MGMFSFFNKNKSDDLSSPCYYEVDFHSHLIPGVDDGSKSHEESGEIIAFFKSLGVRKMIVTPHISMDYYKNSPSDILEKFQLLKTEMINSGSDMELAVAAEYMVDDGFSALVEKRDLLTFGDNYLLVELSSFMQHPEFTASVFELQTAGYNIILAHPERYSFMHKQKDEYTNLKERDIRFQLNILSLTNAYSAEVNKAAKWLIENKMIDFIGSDIHHASQIDYYRKALSTNLFTKFRETNPIKNNSL
jgi:protein-tyrosine phosphatase